MDAISWQLLIEGAWTTLWISAIAIAFGVVAGLLIALVRMLRLPVIDQLLVVYISLARATPLVTLVLFLFLSLPTMGINLDKNVAAIVALTLNTSAFNAEIWRNAFRTFPREQREAAESVGMRRWTYFRYIMLPQMWWISPGSPTVSPRSPTSRCRRSSPPACCMWRSSAVC